MCDNPVPFKSINNKTYRQYEKYFTSKKYMDSLKVPCGYCLGCRMDRLALWSARCNYEQIKGENAFVTFTYNDFFLPYNDGSLFPTLRFEDLHKYLDNLRHKVNKIPFLPQFNRKTFSYFAAGEYGDRFHRPHYHVLFFGLDFQKFKNLFSTSWKNGMIECDPVLSGGVRYVVDYFTKSMVSGDLAETMYDNKGLERPFKSVSRGLGSELFYVHRDEIRNGFDLKIGSRFLPVPLYYKNLYCNFSDDEICSRFSVNKQKIKELSDNALRLGFDCVDDYVLYCARANELALSKKLHDNGVANVPSYKSIDESFDTKIMAMNALKY